MASAECKCESNFTCGYCLRNAKPWLFTPSSPRGYFSQENHRRFLLDQKAIADGAAVLCRCGNTYASGQYERHAGTKRHRDYVAT